MIARPLVVVAALLGASASVAEADGAAWCREARARLGALAPDDPGAWTRYQEIVAGFPAEAAPLVAYARQRAGAEGSLAAALAVLDGALADGCAAPRSDAAPERARAEVAALLADDERFHGTREKPDAIDALLVWLSKKLEELLESEGMRLYAETSRFLFLSLLGLALLVIAVRLWRARARERAAPSSARVDLAVERERVRAFAEWRREADARLAEGDLRGALRAGQMALLARLGEVDRDAVTPARTNREILLHLEEAPRSVAAGPLSAFDRAFFGGRADASAVTRFLVEVDGAARALSGVRERA